MTGIPGSILVDGSGSWLQLGELTPIISEWQFFPVLGESFLSVIRLTFTFPDANQLPRIKSFIRVKAAYQSGSFFTEELPSIKAFPRVSQLILNYPTPNDLARRGVYRRKLSIKKYRNNRRLGYAYDQNWTVFAEELMPREGESPGGNYGSGGSSGNNSESPDVVFTDDGIDSGES